VLDLDLIGQIHAAVSVPLVLHGSSGVPDDMLAAAVRAGLTKINIATQLNKQFTAAVRAFLASEAAVVDPRRYVAAGRDASAGVASGSTIRRSTVSRFAPSTRADSSYSTGSVLKNCRRKNTPNAVAALGRMSAPM